MGSEPPLRYRVELLPTVEDELAAYPKKVQGQIARRIDKLAEAPRPAGFKELHGRPGTFRVRSGDCRILYRVEDDVLLVLVVKVGPRKDVYRSLERL